MKITELWEQDIRRTSPELIGLYSTKEKAEAARALLKSLKPPGSHLAWWTEENHVLDPWDHVIAWRAKQE